MDTVKTMPKWSKTDELKALCIYKFGTDNIPYKEDEVAKQMGKTLGALKMRIYNIQYLYQFAF